jgi:hypothetical protein
MGWYANLSIQPLRVKRQSSVSLTGVGRERREGEGDTYELDLDTLVYQLLPITHPHCSLYAIPNDHPSR